MRAVFVSAPRGATLPTIVPDTDLPSRVPVVPVSVIRLDSGPS